MSARGLSTKNWQTKNRKRKCWVGQQTDDYGLHACPGVDVPKFWIICMRARVSFAKLMFSLLFLSLDGRAFIQLCQFLTANYPKWSLKYEWLPKAKKWFWKCVFVVLRFYWLTMPKILASRIWRIDGSHSLDAHFRRLLPTYNFIFFVYGNRK